ncbi:hypothetical protein I8H83_05585 [Candidatus Saccharibacteria bacterium]|nr:hypothetical protein [Candidatus Saccharibacteria bacterium]MBH2008043.1 hypothetical protein [Candidatus Saccharibacteria bacterium]
MSKTTLLTTTAIAVALSVGLVLGGGYVAFASTASQIQGGLNNVGGGSGGNLQDGIQTVINLLLFLIGVISVIAIIIGGIRYTTSNGDAGQTKAAKDTIMYAVIGLIVAIMAYAIVRWVVNVFM